MAMNQGRIQDAHSTTIHAELGVYVMKRQKVNSWSNVAQNRLWRKTGLSRQQPSNPNIFSKYDFESSKVPINLKGKSMALNWIESAGMGISIGQFRLT